ncbi:MAG: efflux RND transporter periplasmic adaptor subunit [Gammaproteobacteria bacterium]|nr:efflux RND transporter periplasmic adaptor subunit [Gammaproteobacteria bacterium]MBQ0840161.1 efflux RND transporter periplasmic adaptor subunit [Gammaproteobacteria bacterium]
MNIFKVLVFVHALLGALMCHASGDTGNQKAQQQAAPAAIKGPHGGVLLQDGETSLELAIFERGVPPEYRAWISHQGQVITPSTTQAAVLQVRIVRLGGIVNTFTFAYHGDAEQGGYWLGDGVVEEPHSFDVAASLSIAGKTHQWAWESHEGRVAIKKEIAEKAGIRTALAAPGRIQRTLSAYGSLVSGSENLSHIRARFPGQITRVDVNVGDRVKQGQVIAQIESSESLKRYSIFAPIAGIVTARHANTGELALAQPLFSITNLAKVWAELKIFPQQRAEVKSGQVVTIAAAASEQMSSIRQIIPTDDDPYVLARVPLFNVEGDNSSPWYPGQIVEANIVVEEVDVPLMVDKRALQSFRDWTVVFIQVGENYEIRPLELGRSDKTHVEVLSGLNAGDSYVLENSYLIKADIEKSGASHDH